MHRRPVEVGPCLVGPAVQAHLVSPRHHLGDALGMARTVLALDEERRVEAVPVEHVEHPVVAGATQVVDSDADGRAHAAPGATTPRALPGALNHRDGG